MLELFIAKEFSKTVLETIRRFAKEKAVPEDQIQVYLGLDTSDENVYKICHNYQPYKTVGFTDNGIVKGKMDFSGKSRFVPGAVKDILHAMAQENAMATTQAGLMVMTRIPKEEDENKFPVGLYLYNGTQPVKPVTFEEVFSKLNLNQ